MKLELKEYLIRVGVTAEVEVSAIDPANGRQCSDENPYETPVYCCVFFLRATPENGWRHEYVSFYLRSLPGCCGVLVVHSVNSLDVPQSTVNIVMDGVLEIIRDKARTAEWGKMVLCTTIASQKNFTAWLDHAKFTVGPRTRNPRTGTAITTWTKDLPRPRTKRTQQEPTPV